MRVLITCGPTWVPIDDVRVISNQSSGEMGHLIAQEFAARKAKVTLIEGPVTHVFSNKNVEIIKYNFFDELQKILLEQISLRYDVLIHAAAVSDFKMTKVFKGKLSSSQEVSLKFTPTAKIINSIKIKAPRIFLVGFKLESHLNAANAVEECKELFDIAHCDLVVANTLRNGYKGFIIDKEKNIWLKSDNKKELVQGLVRLINQI